MLFLIHSTCVNGYFLYFIGIGNVSQLYAEILSQKFALKPAKSEMKVAFPVRNEKLTLNDEKVSFGNSNCNIL